MTPTLLPLDHFLYSDQPCTCPTCGARTEIVKEWKDELISQLHVCLNPGCEEMFVMEEETQATTMFEER